MKILFISSGNKGKGINPIIINQGEALAKAGVEVEYYPIVGKGIRGYLRNVLPLRKHVRINHYDAIHAHYSLTAFAASLAGCKHLVVSLMGSDVKASKQYKNIIKLFAKLFRWKTIIVKSKDMYDSLGMPEAVIIPNGVDFDRFKPLEQTECQRQLGWDTNKKHILFPANPSRPEKDFALAQAAVEMIEKTMYEQVEIHVFENVPNDQTPIHYNAADVVLMTSKWEGSPNAIKEAMTCCIPIVSTDVGDVRERLEVRGKREELIEGCYVAESREPEELAELLVKALGKGKDNGDKFRTDGRQRIEEMGLKNEIVAQKLIDLYQKSL